MASNENVKVTIRVRPFSEKEKLAGHKRIVDLDGRAGSVTLRNPNGGSVGGEDGADCKTFSFDAAFGEDSKQADVYDQTAKFIVDEVLKGFNGTVFAYGQTGTGKTFSMQGVRDVPALRGIIPSTFNHIFNHISQDSTSKRYLVRCSYIEIYNEDIRDLLVKPPPGKKPTALELKEHPDTGVYVKDLSSFVVKSVEEMDKLIDVGNSARAVAATLMNAESSRSHSIFTITVESSEEVELSNGTKEDRFVAGKLHLVDLAGSERQSKTGATGDRLKEATRINLSLSALGNCISALVDGKSTHIPYRDSKLTRLLQDSLGGNAKTLMIATLSPASYNYEETLSTLRYANRAKNIKNKPKINEDPKDAMLREYQEEIKRLREQLERKQRTSGGTTSPETRSRSLKAVSSGTLDDEGDESESDGSENGDHQETSKGGHKQANNPLSSMDPATILKLQAQVESERQALLTSKSHVHAEKQRLLLELESRATELSKERTERENLAAKLSSMEGQLLVGGVSIVDRVSAQQLELEAASKRIEQQERAEREIRDKLESKQEATLQLEEHYNTLQDEVDTKTKKLKKLWARLEATRREVSDLQDEFRNEREGLLETIRELSRELSLKQTVATSFLPPDEISKVESRASYNDESDEWILCTNAELNLANRVERPLAHPILKRPVCGFAKTRMAAGDPNPRWRPDNLLTLGLDDIQQQQRSAASSAEYLNDKSTAGSDLDVGELYRDISRASSGTLLSTSRLKLGGGGTGSALGSEDFEFSGSDDLTSNGGTSPTKTMNVDARLPPSRGEVLRSGLPSKRRT
ncbi:hypothetical protein SmJEL517_g00434 [Synchytrium microbalum]|uniref:Kinesin-like protein n=1 Tax=Synchytrium microbalum TaxID=1806994 RepID=A0A507C7V3_9FUNG|nr:uncharacterized protein SmJEL517_g00434 [Synchytrium microbalum]TPX37660.1 hypothetical protein SmJEL517_g00434 [Synchytrium microbalum]